MPDPSTAEAKKNAPKKTSPKTAPNPAQFPHLESAIALRLGSSEEDLRAWRTENLLEGTDYAGGHGHPLRLSDAALEKIAAAFGVDVIQLRARALLSPTIGSELTLTMHRQVPNRRLVEALLPGGSPDRLLDRVLVRVGDSTNFVRGMPIPARLEPDGLWQCLRRPPRIRGRW